MDGNNNNSQYKLATEADFDKFRSACDSSEGWNLCYEEPNLKVWDQVVHIYIQPFFIFIYNRRTSL